jgi:diguanylate cyclase (GGDEF)-like protein
MTDLLKIRTIQAALSVALLSVAIPAIIMTAGIAAWLSLGFASDAADDLRTGIERVAKTRMAESANKKISEVAQVSNSTLVATSLVDTSGREIYLRPYLEERANITGARFGVYDYRGRPVLQIGSGNVAPNPPQPELVEVQKLRLALQEDSLLVESPIRAYDGSIIGYLVGHVPMFDLLNEAQVLPSRFFEVSAELRVNPPDDASNNIWFLVFEDGDARLFGTIDVEASSLWFRQHVGSTAQFALIIVGLMIGFVALLARFLSNRLTRPLRQLTAATALFRNGRIGRLPESRMIELDTLARALETTFLERRMLENQLKEKAAKDQLLEITNRAHFDTAAEALLARLRPQGEASLLFIDLDRFKTINDNYGHEAGDRVLQIAVERIKRRIRQSDMIGRRGGDEFTVLLSNVDRENARRIAQDIISVISEPMIIEGIGVVEIGASIGLAHFPDDAETLRDLMAAADTAMYQAKATGRGRVAQFAEADAP